MAEKTGSTTQGTTNTKAKDAPGFDVNEAIACEDCKRRQQAAEAEIKKA